MKEDTKQMFKMKAGRRQYYVAITTKYGMYTNKPMSYHFDIGGKMNGCIRIIANVPNPSLMHDERFRALESTMNIAFISWIGYNPKCSITEDLPGGDGTRHMIKTSMSVVCNVCPWISFFKLSDASKVRCVQGIDISLANLSYFTNGQSYYEKYLNAYLANEVNRTRYQERRQLLTDANVKIPIDAFCDKFQIRDDIAKNIYHSSSTYLEFANNLKQACKEQNCSFCVLINPWLDTFISYILGRDLQDVWMNDWLIDKSSIGRINVTEWSEVSDVQEVQNIYQEEFKEYYMEGGFKNASFSMEDLD